VVFSEPVTVRRLPVGDWIPGILHSLEGSLLKVTIERKAGNPPFEASDLVEIACSQTVYLGAVRGRHDDLLTVGIEHSVDREALSAIQQVWYRPQGE
jgi:hypothetical protein